MPIHFSRVAVEVCCHYRGLLERRQEFPDGLLEFDFFGGARWLRIAAHQVASNKVEVSKL